jgi:hypothetical protein
MVEVAVSKREFLTALNRDQNSTYRGMTVVEQAIWLQQLEKRQLYELSFFLTYEQIDALIEFNRSRKES